MKIGIKTLKTAVIYGVMNKTCCRVDWNDPGGRAFALYFLYPPLGIWQLKCHSPHECAIHYKNGRIPGVVAHGGGQGTVVTD